MKKIVMVVCCVALAMSIAVPTFALEFKGLKKEITAYSPDALNAIMEANGLSMSADAVKNVPASYATVKNGKVAFGKTSIAYEPKDLHSVFTAYGLTLSPEEVQRKLLGATDYAKVKDGKVVFGKQSAAYSGKTLELILSAYTLPGTVAVAPTPTTPSTPVKVAPAVPAKPMDKDNDGVADDKDKCEGTPPGAIVDEDGCWSLKADYLFDFDKAVIKKQYYSNLDSVAKVIQDNPTLKVEIQGHTDSIGTDAYNMGLSKRRAQAVKDYLVKKGIDAKRLSIKGFGESTPKDTNTTKEGRAKNRRVELDPRW